MAYFKRNRFSGIAPGVAPNLLAEQFGQTSANIDFESGSLVPIKKDEGIVSTGSPDTRSAYFFRPSNDSLISTWLTWNAEDVDVVEGPIPGDSLYRLYYTGDSYPRVTAYTQIRGSAADSVIVGPFPDTDYRLGVPAPDNTPATPSLTGTLNQDRTPEDISYVYTFVTAFGEEGPPSQPTPVIQATISSTEQTATVAIPSYGGSSSGLNFGGNARKRIYRSNTGSTNTTFQLVDDVPYSQTSYPDSTPAAALQEVLPSSTWIGPPDDNVSLYPDGQLRGLTTVANGVLAGFTGKRLCLSEPFLPHAWPISYRITLEDDIIGIGTTANGIVCLTKGRPYFVTGVDPSAMSALQVDLAQSCINAKSIVDMGEYVLYAGPDGLCAISGTEGRVVTKGLISPEQWLNATGDFCAESYRAFLYEGTYVAFVTVPIAGGGTVKKGWVFDPRADEAALSTLTDDMPDVVGGLTDSVDGKMYILKFAGNIQIDEWRGHVSNRRRAVFKSKKLIFPKPASMAWVGVYADSYPLPVSSGGSIDYSNLVKVIVFADNVEVARYVISKSNNLYNYRVVTANNFGVETVGAVAATMAEPIMRLPATVAREWEVQVESSTTIRELCLSETMDEIKQA